MSINRRWDPCIWQGASGKWHMLNLAADYSAEGNSKPWWMRDNTMELWTGDSLDDMTLASAWPRQWIVWTSPSVFGHGGAHWACVGLNEEGETPHQHIRLVDPYTLQLVAELPDPLPQYAKGGRSAWRDATIQRVGDGSFLMAITTGGFRWGTPPNVILYRSRHLAGGWWCDGPCFDPALAVLFGELERPQIHRLKDGRWALTFSTWPERQFIRVDSGNMHVVTSAGEDPVFSRLLGSVDVPYGYRLSEHDGEHIATGWEWVDRTTYSSRCAILSNQPSIDDLVNQMEKSNAEAALH